MIISGISGREYDSEYLTLNPVSYHVTVNGGEDVTNDIRRADKIALFPGFDVETENRRLSNERAGGYGPVGELSESTGGALLEQLATDPLGAPLDALNKGINQIFTAPGVVKLAIILAAVGVGIWFVRKKL